MRQSLLLVLTVLVLCSSAQQVQRCCGNGNSTFLWGFPTASHTQCLYLPGDLSNATSGDIPRLYWRYGSTGIANGNTLTGVTIRLGQTAQTGFTGGNLFFTGLDTLLSADTLEIPHGNTGDWFGISLDTVFPYNMNQTLIVDVFWTTSAVTNFGCLGVANNDRKLHANNNVDLTGSTSSTTWQDIGFDLQTSTGVPPVLTAAPAVYPVPTSGLLYVERSHEQAAPAWVRIVDAQGSTVISAPIATDADRTVLDLSVLAPGVYVVEQEGDLPVRIIKE